MALAYDGYMDFTNPQLIADFRAFEDATEKLGDGEYAAVTENWASFVQAAEALAKHGDHSARIRKYYYDDDEFASFPDGEVDYDSAWLETWFCYFDYQQSVVSGARWVAQAHAWEKLMNSFSDSKSWFTEAWDWERGIWKS